MGQLALGFRSLLTKAAIFFVMAALLAWALGGTLWPRPAYAEVWPEKPVTAGDLSYYWRLTVQSGRPGRVTSQRPTWQLMAVEGGNGRLEADTGSWSDGAGPVRGRDGVIYFGGRDQSGQWWIMPVGKDARHRMPDRFAVEQQLARLALGLPLQSYETVLHLRSAALDPADDE